jgi:hypothetical protein
MFYIFLVGQETNQVFLRHEKKMACRSKPLCDYRLWITTPLLYRFMTVSINESLVVFGFAGAVSQGLSE